MIGGASSSTRHFICVSLLWVASFELRLLLAEDTCRPVNVPGCEEITHARDVGVKSAGIGAASHARTLERYLSLLKSSGSANELLLRKIWCYQLAPPCEDYPRPPCRSMCVQAEGAFIQKHGPMFKRDAVRRITKNVHCAALPYYDCDTGFEGEFTATFYSVICPKSRLTFILWSEWSFGHNLYICKPICQRLCFVYVQNDALKGTLKAPSVQLSWDLVPLIQSSMKPAGEKFCHVFNS